MCGKGGAIVNTLHKPNGRCVEHNLLHCSRCAPATPTASEPVKPAAIAAQPAREKVFGMELLEKERERTRALKARNTAPEEKPPAIVVQPEPVTLEADTAVASQTDTAVGPNVLFERIAMRSVAQGYRVFPANGKQPCIKGFPELATTDTAQIKKWAAQFPDASCGILGTPEGHLFIDEDMSQEFRQGYESFAGEPFPLSRTTESRPNHRQSHWIQTDYTRAQLRNIKQNQTKESMFSLRFSNMYVLGEGSRHPSGSTYRVVVDSPAIPMPNRLVDYIRGLETQERTTTTQAGAVQAVRAPSDTTIPPRFDIKVAEGGRNNTVSE
jgi:hypothetical protein